MVIGFVHYVVTCNFMDTDMLMDKSIILSLFVQLLSWMQWFWNSMQHQPLFGS